MKYTKLFILPIIFSFLFNCKGLQKVTNIEEKKENIEFITKIDTLIVEKQDTFKFDSLLTEFLVLNNKISSREKDTIWKDSIKIKIKTITKKLYKGASKDTTYNINIPIDINLEDSLIKDSININLQTIENNIKIKVNNNIKLDYIKTSIVNKYIRKITFFNWIKDSKTLFLLFILIILIFIFVKRK